MTGLVGGEETRSYWSRFTSVLFLLLLLWISGGVVLLMVGLWLFVYPWNRAHYRTLISWFCQATWVDALQFMLPNTRIRITGDSDLPDGISAAIIVVNHRFDIDWWHVVSAMTTLGLHGNIKVMMNEEMQSIPLIGAVLGLFEFPFLTNRWTHDRGLLFSMLSSFAFDGYPALILVRPEGDSVSDRARALRKSVEFARREGRPELAHLLLPRSNNFSLCVDAMRTSSPAIYDMTFAYNGMNGEVEGEEEEKCAFVEGGDEVKSEERRGEGEGAGVGGERPVQNDDTAADDGNSHNDDGFCRGGDLSERRNVRFGAGVREDDENISLPPSIAANRRASSAAESDDSSATFSRQTASESIVRRLGISPGNARFRQQLVNLFQGGGPQEVAVRIKRYSIEEVVADSHWLDNRWLEKDRLMSHYERHGQFPTSGRGFSSRVADSRGSLLAFARLLMVPLSLPVIIFFAIPGAILAAMMFVAAKMFTTARSVARNLQAGDAPLAGITLQSIIHHESSAGGGDPATPSRTPYSLTPFPPTPFTSPFMSSPFAWAFSSGTAKQGGR